MLTQLRYFLAVVKYHNFTEAAEACHISQSAISQQIKALEQELGVPLLTRQGRSFAMTPAGELLYQRGLQLLADYERLCHDVKRLGTESESSLHIGYLRDYTGPELQRAVATFYETHREVEIHVTSGTHEEIYEMLRNNTIQVAFSDQRRVFSQDYLNIPLQRNHCYVEMSASNPLSELEQVEMSALKQMPCILLSSKEQQLVEADYYRTYRGVQGDFIFADNVEEARLLVLSNRGYMIVEGKEFEPTFLPHIVRLPVYHGGERLTRQYCLFAPLARLTTVVKDFAHIMEASF